LVHDYGHCGAGITLSWGIIAAHTAIFATLRCGREAPQIARTDSGTRLVVLA
jgi:hypothetical protein